MTLAEWIITAVVSAVTSTVVSVLTLSIMFDKPIIQIIKTVIG